MRSPTCTAVAAVGVLSVLPLAQVPITLLTVPQRDRFRTNGAPPSASITGDGRYITFTSYERLTPDDTNTNADIYVLDRETGVATLESTAEGGVNVGSDCSNPRISRDGRFVVFETALARNDGSLVGADVVIRDRIENTMRLVSRNIAGALADGWSAGAAISDDGGTIVFSSTATDLVPGLDANGLRSDIYLFRADTSLIQRISLNVVGLQPSTGSSMAPSVSAEGRYVAFTSTAELVSPSRAPRTADPESPGRSVSHVYVRDTQLHQTTRVAPKDRVPNGSSMSAVISRDGRFVAFVSQATNLVADDRNRSTDVFLFDRSTGSIALVSRNMAGRPANGASGNPSVSSDSRLVAFQSDASDLTCADGCRSLAEDINLVTDVFLFDRSTSTVTQISGGAGGWMEESVAPAVDATGQVVAFTSRHPIDAWDVDDDFDLFLQVSSAPR